MKVTNVISLMPKIKTKSLYNINLLFAVNHRQLIGRRETRLSTQVVAEKRWGAPGIQVFSPVLSTRLHQAGTYCLSPTI